MAATKHAQAIKNDTKDYITTALLQMLAKEKLQTLTVSQVCKRAGVSRMAFYRNFDGLEQILYQYYQPKIAAVFDIIHQNSQDSVKYNSQMEFFTMFGDSLIISADHGFEPIIQQIFIEEIKKFYAPDSEGYWTTFMSAGVYAIWRKWLLEGQQKPLNEIMDFLKQFDLRTEESNL
ncbi:TetR/AcrR family transcriptional regulator [Anaerocolumna chitinilytica]|uniref:AcrR family transcriptional regulator n=1 Tax=Anaerocolumna chitinilytica TaxID=1727145 RepID=A0A7I8DKG1_9FIRM|nr:TetR/AcrR family transcriptional regulator [Anaerocolumna chitinilytica]BCJ98958.1 AcrR family transcriptional regulator [Anaerocolumna chitinilytica]